MKNYLHVSGLVRDGSSLWQLLKAFAKAGAANVEVRPVEMPETAPEKPTAKPRKNETGSVVLKHMKPGTPATPGELAKKTGLTRKQANMALWNLKKRGKVKSDGKGTYTLEVAA